MQPPRIALTTFGTTSMQAQAPPHICDPQDHTLLVSPAIHFLF